MSSVLDILEETLPELFPRSKVSELTGGVIASGTCANADSRGDGVEGRVMVGNKICYTKRCFIEFMKTRVKIAKRGKVGNDTTLAPSVNL